MSVTNEILGEKTGVIRLVIGLLMLSLLGCNPTDLQDLTTAVSDPATLAATVVKTQPTKKPTRTPTHTATKNVTPSPASHKRVKDTPGDFDFYVLVLSWSPDYCASSNVNDPQQCSLGKKLGFVLHGLWPQYTRGYPADCSTVKLPKDASQQYPNLYPSSSLYTHEWAKHGTCSGLKPLDYLALSKSLKESVTIPTTYRSPIKAFRVTVDDLKADFIDANATLSEDTLAVQCSGSGRFLKELYVCFSRDGQPVACSAEIQKDATQRCGRADFLVRNVK